MIRTVFVFAIAFVICGCTSLRTIETTSLSIESFSTDQELRREVPKKFLAQLRLRYSATKDSISGKGRIVSTALSNSRLELRDPFGKLHYSAMSDGKEFVAHYPPNGLAYVDSIAGRAYFEKLFGMPLEFAELFEIFLGAVPKSLSSGKIEGWKEIGNNRIEASFAATNGWSVTAEVDTKLIAVRKLRLSRSETTIDVNYDDFVRCCDRSSENAQVAHWVEVRRESPTTSIEVEWIEMGRDPKSPSKIALDLPANVTRIPLP